MTVRADHEARNPAYSELLSARKTLAHEVNVNALVLSLSLSPCRALIRRLLLSTEPFLPGFVAS